MSMTQKGTNQHVSVEHKGPRRTCARHRRLQAERAKHVKNDELGNHAHNAKGTKQHVTVGHNTRTSATMFTTPKAPNIKVNNKELGNLVHDARSIKQHVEIEHKRPP